MKERIAILTGEAVNDSDDLEEDSSDDELNTTHGCRTTKQFLRGAQRPPIWQIGKLTTRQHRSMCQQIDHVEFLEILDQKFY